jgi:adenylosuccinate lyase
VCPLDSRYGSAEMKAIFSEEAKLQKMLLVEAAVAQAHAKFGNIPVSAAKTITKYACTKHIKIERVKELESILKHDITAVAQALSEKCGSAGEYVHLGLTSNDIIDTATALQMSDALKIIKKDLVELSKTFCKLAQKYKNTVIAGRTHGQYAVPTTFGFKIACFKAEVDRHIQRLIAAQKRVCVGKISGAVGTGAALGRNALEIQKYVMQILKLNVDLSATQIVARDRYAELVCILANIVTSAEKFATEVRNLQRTEIGEVAEYFFEKQVGSSAMPQKRNPIISENICSLARIVRSFVNPAFENIVLWHERDLTNSASERFIIPHCCILTDDILRKTINVYKNLRVYTKKMYENIVCSDGTIMAEAVMSALIKKGVGRWEAYDIIRRCVQTAFSEGKRFQDILISDKTVRKYLTEREILNALEPSNYLGSASKLVEKICK